MKKLEARFRLVEGELVLIGDPAARSLEICQAQSGELKSLGRLSLADPSELSRLFEQLTRAESAPPSTAGPMQPFQPPPDQG